MMIGVALAALLVTALAEKPEGCGFIGTTLLNRIDDMRMMKRSMIVGGGGVKSFEAPWIVRVDIDRQHHCSGTLIAEDKVLTAGHCFVFKDNRTKTCSWIDRNYSVCLHESYNTGSCPDGRTLKVKKVLHDKMYLQYKCAIEYDFVVLELEKKVKDIQPVCLPVPSNGVPFPHQYPSPVFLLGYSPNTDVDEPRGPPNKYLKLVNAGQPTSKGEGFILLKTGHHDKRVGICGGDSGGPMIEIHNNRSVIVGVNVRSKWNCDVTKLVFLPDEDGTGYYQYAVAVQPRLTDLDGTLFPQFA